MQEDKFFVAKGRGLALGPGVLSQAHQPNDRKPSFLFGKKTEVGIGSTIIEFLVILAMFETLIYLLFARTTYGIGKRNILTR